MSRSVEQVRATMAAEPTAQLSTFNMRHVPPSMPVLFGRGFVSGKEGDEIVVNIDTTWREAFGFIAIRDGDHATYVAMPPSEARAIAAYLVRMADILDGGNKPS